MRSALHNANLIAKRAAPKPTLSEYKKSNFYKEISKKLPGNFGIDLADSVALSLIKSGYNINPHQIKYLTRGNNTSVFDYMGKIVLKIVNNIETHQQIAIKTPLLLKNIMTSTVGFDPGQVPITLEVAPLLNVKDVTPEHTASLCKALYDMGIIFEDNKLANVGLTKSGSPYVIDGGSLKEAPKNKKPNFIYPHYSGYNEKTNKWEINKSFPWPKDQRSLFEFKSTERFLRSPNINAYLDK